MIAVREVPLSGSAFLSPSDAPCGSEPQRNDEQVHGPIHDVVGAVRAAAGGHVPAPAPPRLLLGRHQVGHHE